MIEVIDNASASQLRQWWVKIPKAILAKEGVNREREDAQRYIYDEIAFTLTRTDPNWVEFLLGFAESNDPNRRCSALFALSTEGEPTEELKASLLNAFQSKHVYLKGSAIQGLIHIGHFPLSESELANISDEWLAAWVMRYQCEANPKQIVEILTESLTSNNPMIRSFACDIIGDQQVEHLKPLLEPLLKDANEHVAEVAAYTYYEMLD